MPDPAMNVLLDQNVPVAAAIWLREQQPKWAIWHVNELGYQGKSDECLYLWAQVNQAIVITYDGISLTHAVIPWDGTMASFGSGCGPLPRSVRLRR